jgi:serine protease Do
MRIRSGLIPFMGIITPIITIAISAVWVMSHLNAEAPPEVAYLGIRFAPMEPLGARVDDVLPGSPADEAGLQSGDIIFTLDGVYVDGQGLLNQIGLREPQDIVTLGIQRHGEDHNIQVTLTNRPEIALDPVVRASLSAPTNSYHLSDVATPTANGYWRITALDETGLLREAGLAVGDVITHIDGVDIANTREHQLATYTLISDRTSLTVQREGETLEYDVPATLARLLILGVTSSPTLE